MSKVPSSSEDELAALRLKREREECLRELREIEACIRRDELATGMSFLDDNETVFGRSEKFAGIQEEKTKAAVSSIAPAAVSVPSAAPVVAPAVKVWACSFSHYCKYGDMSSKDGYVGLSLSIADANKRLFDATRGLAGDCMDEIDRGSDIEPASMTLFPGGGQYVLNASVEDLGSSCPSYSQSRTICN